MASKGKNEAARSLLDIQPTALLEFFQVYPNYIDNPSFYIPFHGGAHYGKALIWKGVQYLPMPIETEGFETAGDGRIPRPKIRVSNKDGLITNLLLNNKDFINAQIVRTRVYLKHIDDVNFEGGNPFGKSDPNAAVSEDNYYIGQKTQETKAFVEFELNSPLDLDNFEIANRTVNAKYCYWRYRGEGCRYEGPPIERDDGTLFQDVDGNIVNPKVPVGESFYNNPLYEFSITKNYSAGDVVWVENNKILVNRPNSEINSNKIPVKTVYVCVSGSNGLPPDNNPSFWQKDGCTKKLFSCQKHFNSDQNFEYLTGQNKNSFDSVQFSGNKNKENVGYFSSEDSSLTGAFKNDFSIMGVFSLSNGSEEGSAIMKTFNYGGYSTGYAINLETLSDGRAAFKYRDGYNELKSIPFSPKTRDLTNNNPSFNQCLISVSKSVNFPFTNLPQIHIEVNGRQLIKDTFYSGEIEIDNFTLGGTPELNSSINGQISSFAVWNRNLLNKERDYLCKKVNNFNGIKKPNKEIVPRDYDECTGEFSNIVSDSLHSWWDIETGNINGSTLLLDRRLSSDLTGYQNFKFLNHSYETSSFSSINQTDEVIPRFGGFPATDGFSYGN